MQQTLQARTRPFSLIFTPYLLVMSILGAGFAGVTVGTEALEQSRAALTDPFPAYADVFPGQPERSAQVGAKSCETVYRYSATPQESCTFIPRGGIFSSVEVVFSRGIIRSITFTLGENTLKVGDLEILFGISATYASGQAAYFYLSGRLAVAETDARQYSRFLTVKSITFTSAPL